MAEYAAALEAFKRATALAADHHAALDTAARLMAAHTWVGGGATAFTTTLADSRTRLQTALSSALQSLATQVVRQGGPPPFVPQVTTTPVTLSPTPSAFQGIDPRAMTALAASLDQAAHTLTAAGARLATELSTHGLPSQPGHTVGQIASWAATQSTDLRRRLTLIQHTVPTGPLPSGLTAHHLFGAHAPDPHATGTLLNRLATGDRAALKRLLELQGRDADLAARVNAWWRGLAEAVQSTLVGVGGFGLLNGVPSKVRDTANRGWLAREKARLTAELDRATTTFGHPLDLGGWERIANQLRRIEYIEKKIIPVSGYPPPLLLAFDVTGQGRLVVSWGDPDTADITVTNVSGLTSGLDVAHGDLERARALWRQADATSGGRTIASITWLGYDAPQLDPGLIDPGRTVALGNAAAAGGRALAAFTDGLRASHEPSATARQVVVGHSYGSLTTGHAARLRPGRLADELIFVGSPGVGVDHAGELGMDPRRVWVGEAGGDPVAALGRFGADPGNASFGARHFPVGREVYTAAHSSYWDADSASLRNIGRLINGQHDKLTAPPPLNDKPQLLMPELDPDLALKLNR
ncbi:alpha/beta hydrolase [Nonomuraea sp. NPDC050663]|uniref:alpha/beta hydrolase n=1 Tax=Nonomuraea sp. NPDC050663 TaxID=3364370 RepID=UPI00379C69E5